MNLALVRSVFLSVGQGSGGRVGSVCGGRLHPGSVPGGGPSPSVHETTRGAAATDRRPRGSTSCTVSVALPYITLCLFLWCTHTL